MTTLGNGQQTRTPSGMKVAPTSYAKLEIAANSLRPALPPASNGAGSHAQYKLDGWRILEQTLPKAGYQFSIAGLNELEDCAAFTIPERGLVVIREDVYNGLFEESPFSRSTVIHELAHIALGHAVTLHRGAVLGQHRFCEDSEWQAKALTAAIMMPLEACLKARSPHHLAEMCGTSEQAAKFRLQRLIKQGTIPPTSSLFE